MTQSSALSTTKQPKVALITTPGGDSDAFNLGNGNGFSVQQVIDAARRITGKNIEVKESPRRPGDPARLVANSERAKRVLGWQPQYADLDVIVGHAWAWERKLCVSKVSAGSTSGSDQVLPGTGA